MIARKCDRCGEFYEKSRSVITFSTLVDPGSKFDLCPNCTADFKLWIKNKGSVVEVVRCKDCKYCDGDDNCDEPVRWCEKIKGEEFFVTDNFFCSSGERKEAE